MDGKMNEVMNGGRWDFGFEVGREIVEVIIERWREMM